MEVPVPVLAERVGLSTGLGATRLPLATGVFLDGGETDRVAAASGLLRPVLDGMHVGRWAPGWLGFDADAADRRLALRRLVSSRRVLPGWSRCCPACLTDRPGVWSLRWRLVASFACTVHNVPLAERCRRCRRQVMCGNPDGHAHEPASLSRNAPLTGDRMPDPGACPATVSGRRCGTPYAGPAPAPDPVLAATQPTVDRAIDAGDDAAALDLHALASVQRAHRHHCKLPPPAGTGSCGRSPSAATAPPTARTSTASAGTSTCSAPASPSMSNGPRSSSPPAAGDRAVRSVGCRLAL